MQGRSSWLFRSGTAEETVTLKGSLRTTAAEGLREAVFADLGLSVAAEWMFQPDLDNGRVKQVLPAWTLPPMDLWAAFPTGRRASAKARAFASFIEDQLARPASGNNPRRTGVSLGLDGSGPITEAIVTLVPELPLDPCSEWAMAATSSLR
jgi:hypothetical protein